MEGCLLVEKNVDDYKREINRAAASVSRKTEEEMVKIFNSFLKSL